MIMNREAIHKLVGQGVWSSQLPLVGKYEPAGPSFVVPLTTGIGCFRPIRDCAPSLAVLADLRVQGRDRDGDQRERIGWRGGVLGVIHRGDATAPH
jgi:hypothetical protein